MVGEAGLEPAHLAAQGPKPCVYANFTTRPIPIAKLQQIVSSEITLYGVG